MRIAIAGAGWCGALLSNKLTEYGSVDVYEQNRKPTAVCGCGIPTDFFVDLAKAYGLNPEDYIHWKANQLIVNFGKKISPVPMGNLCTFNKQKFIEDLVNQSSATFHFGETLKHANYHRYNLIIDATGTREILGKLATDQLFITYQVKAKFTKLPYPDFYMNFSNPPNRCLWMFPLSDKEAHVGCGSQNGQQAFIQVEQFLKNYNAKTLEKQAKPLRLNPPQESLPFCNGKIVGVGNTIGAITSLGEGNALSATTVQLLLENLNSLQHYTTQVLKKLKWLKHDYAFYYAWLQNHKLRTLYHILRIRKLYRERFRITNTKQLLMAIV